MYMHVTTGAGMRQNILIRKVRNQAQYRIDALQMRVTKADLPWMAMQSACKLSPQSLASQRYGAGCRGRAQRQATSTRVYASRSPSGAGRSLQVMFEEIVANARYADRKTGYCVQPIGTRPRQ